MLFGFGLPWILVGEYTLLQRRTPAHLQGRAYGAVELMTGAPQTVSIALGAGLVAVVDYRLMLAVIALVTAAAGPRSCAAFARAARSASHESPVLLDELAVRGDPPAAAQVADEVPVQRGLVRPPVSG